MNQLNHSSGINKINLEISLELEAEKE